MTDCSETAIKLKLLSDILLNLSDSELTKLIHSGDIFEVNDDV